MKARILGGTIVALVLMMGISLASTPNARADQSVTVTAASVGKITLAIGDQTATFGSNLDPTGANATGEISAVTSTTGNQGAYYVWTPSSVPNITVRSNAPWSGTVLATENSGAGASSTMTVSGGSLRYCAGSAPGSYSAAAGCTSLTTSAANWATSVAKGVWTYTHYFTLKVDWDDNPGSFNSSVTYAVSQS